MQDSISHRIFLAHLELSYRLGRKVTQAEFGDLVAQQLGRPAAFTAAAVSRWEAGTKVPGPAIIEAIAAVTHTDPGWISHGSRSAAPRPRAAETPRVTTGETPQSVPAVSPPIVDAGDPSARPPIEVVPGASARVRRRRAR